MTSATRTGGVATGIIAVVTLTLGLGAGVAILPTTSSWAGTAAGPSSATLRHTVKADAVKEDVGNASSVTCTQPKKWVKGKAFKCVVHDAQQEVIATVSCTVAATSGGYWHWNEQ